MTTEYLGRVGINIMFPNFEFFFFFLKNFKFFFFQKRVH